MLAALHDLSIHGSNGTSEFSSLNGTDYDGYFQFVGSDNWGNKMAAIGAFCTAIFFALPVISKISPLGSYSRAARGSITIIPQQKPDAG